MSGWLFFWRRPGKTFDRWSSPEQLRRSLQRERELADRFGGGFSLLVLSARRRETQRQLFAELAKVFHRRLRCSDTFGWLDPEHAHAAVIMHRTAAGGAWKVAAAVCGALAKEIEVPLCEVYTYPFAPPWSDLAVKDSVPSVAGQKCAVQCMEPILACPPPHSPRAADVLGTVSEKTSCV